MWKTSLSYERIEDEDPSTSSTSFIFSNYLTKPDFYRYLGLGLFLSVFFFALITNLPLTNPIVPTLNASAVLKYPIDQTCIPGVFRDVTQLPFAYWKPNKTLDISLPVYWTHSLDEVNVDIEHVILVQHGNLRDANDYFCGAVNAFQHYLKVKNDSNIDPNTVMIISPQFLTDGDICWHQFSNQLLTVKASENTTCDSFVWTSEGWKDGHRSVNYFHQTNAPDYYSYEIFTVIINRLIDQTYFPKLKKISLFGFSAGAQVLLRYSMWPNYDQSLLNNHKITIRSILSDMGTYLYFDNRRAFNNGTVGFGIPNESWLLPEWKVDSTQIPWITKWNESCVQYNDWRYGLEKLEGYYADQSKQFPNMKQDIIKEFPLRNIYFLVGMEDNVNCRLKNYQGCNDNQLATYCPAMLQGSNRLERFLNWKNHLKTFYYHTETQRVTYVPGVSHDAVMMLNSIEAQTVLFS